MNYLEEDGVDELRRKLDEAWGIINGLLENEEKHLRAWDFLEEEQQKTAALSRRLEQANASRDELMAAIRERTKSDAAFLAEVERMREQRNALLEEVVWLRAERN